MIGNFKASGDKITQVLHTLELDLRHLGNIDFDVLRSRYSNEGLPFLTVVLPELHKDWLQSLSPTVNGWATFDGSPDQFWAIHQVASFFSKVASAYTPEQEKKAFASFMEVQAQLSSSRQTVYPSSWVKAKETIDSIFRYFPKNWRRRLEPRHGPGVTSESAVCKYDLLTCDTADPDNFGYYIGSPYCAVTAYTETSAKLICVPKDNKGPRLISAEPVNRQFRQQALAHLLMTFLEKECSITRGRINFSDQSINAELALRSSTMKGKCYSTLDLKEASDRVSLELVSYLFADTPIRDFLLTTRSSSTRLPDGSLIELESFAPMGSALCFPIEALVFFSVLRTVTNDCYVYGDDIITLLSKNEARELFQDFGFLLNEKKSFDSGPFRESCGCDAYMGHDVTPVRLRTLDNGFSTLETRIATRNQLYEAGLWYTARCLEPQESLHTFPVWCGSESPYVLRTFQSTYILAGTPSWVGKAKSYQVPCVFTYARVSVEQKVQPSGIMRLFRNLSRPGSFGPDRVRSPKTRVRKQTLFVRSLPVAVIIAARSLRRKELSGLLGS